MKKILLVAAVVLALGIAAVYIFIPSTITVSCVRPVRAMPPAVSRFLADTAKIYTAIQPSAGAMGNDFTYNGFTYHLNKLMYNGTEFSVKKNQDTVSATLIGVDLDKDSGFIYWTANIHSSTNPFTRLSQYVFAHGLKNSMSGLIDQMKNYLDTPAHLYGIGVKEIELKDSVLISTKSHKATEPAIADIYLLVKKLKDYALSEQVTATNYPMVNIQQNETGGFDFMVGLPVSRTVPQTADINIKYMPYRGKMFITEVKGGPGTIKTAAAQLKEFVTDSRRSVPAIPFELMVTDRSMESDTSKWETMLYYPVM
ncbi:MAG: GyrI-like domain-containing protein [Bacteroidetes bacterium]|nr:GyrI-like domain-containing protein [Bacteroidota bacterium]